MKMEYAIKDWLNNKLYSYSPHKSDDYGDFDLKTSREIAKLIDKMYNEISSNQWGDNKIAIHFCEEAIFRLLIDWRRMKSGKHQQNITQENMTQIGRDLINYYYKTLIRDQKLKYLLEFNSFRK